MAWDTTSQVTGNQQNQNTQNTNTAQSGTGSVTNQYTAGQQGLQGKVPGAYGDFLGGNIPSTFTMPQPVIDNFTKQFNTWSAPSLALNGGAGSPQIAGNYAMGLSDLMARLYQQGVGNYQGALAGADNSAFGRPTGTNTVDARDVSQTGGSTANQQYSQETQQKYAAMEALLKSLSAFG